MTTRRVVITGMGTVNPLAHDVETFWRRLSNGDSGIGMISHFDATPFASHIGGEVKDWAGVGGIVGVRELKRFDRFAQFAIHSSVQAVADAGLDFEKENKARCGVLIGSGIGGLETLETQHLRLLAKGPSRVSPFTVPRLMGNAASGNVAILWGLRGHNSSVATACASAGNAIGDAYRLIQSGQANVMLTGGSEAALTQIGLASFCALRALSTRNDDPAGASRPFDKDRDGFVLSEGAGVLVLEELEHARSRGARILAEMAGYGSTCDGSHITAPDPSGIGAADAIRQALDDAGIGPADVQYINAHGTSTELNDIAETKAVKAVFGARARNGLVLSSTKSAVGHLLGASGGVELIATVKMIQDSMVAPTLNLDSPDEGCDLDYCPKEKRPLDITYAMSNSFGFGGHNVVLVIRKFQD
ncbi:MAG TPA: beta-ketoacyl-ACP synthase II [Phycisphaerae bacterium]|nr:beta-ketoacyl-ACP synthase II [Phycisphaerae bacterium]